MVPVLVGTGVAAGDGRVHIGRALLALVVSLALQVGTNYANDYGDGVRGTDDVRVGPVRLVAGGIATAESVRAAAWLSFAVAAAAGLALAAMTTWWLVPVGVACVGAGWLYTAGPRPYGYLGLGELFVFVFFGLVATAGTAYVQEERLTWTMLIAAVPVGCLATALLVVNNLRDIPTDAIAGKRTLAVRLGDRRTRALYTALAAFGGPFSIGPVRTVRAGASGPALIPVLQSTARAQLLAGAVLAAALWLLR